jgi:hypothetical protein
MDEASTGSESGDDQFSSGDAMSTFFTSHNEMVALMCPMFTRSKTPFPLKLIKNYFRSTPSFSCSCEPTLWPSAQQPFNHVDKRAFTCCGSGNAAP